MKKIIVPFLIAISIHSKAQEYVDRIGFKLESIAEIDIGWMKTYKATKPPVGKTLGDRVYSSKQIGDCYHFIEWMQQSYLPKGCLGDVGIYQNYIPTFSSTNSVKGNAINEHAAALPLLYGAFSRMYMFLKKDAQGKFTPQVNFSEFWRIEANQLQQISLPVSFISSINEYYFIIPDFTQVSKGYKGEDKAAGNFQGFANHQNIAPYRHFYIPPKTIADNSSYVVIMTKDNAELPFEKITVGEFFTQTEKQFPVWQKITPVSEENLARAKRNLESLKAKYKNKWNDAAELNISGTDISLIDFVNGTDFFADMFDNKGGQDRATTFPILKVKKSVLALCKSDVPQWLVIRWTMGMPNQAFNIHLHESILNNFNFKYVYDYFFDPEKVKDQAYKPLRSPTYVEAVTVNAASDATKKNAADKNSHFFEDFSTSTIGKKPVGWQSTIDRGATSVVAKLDGLDGNWAVIGNHTITPSLKTPLPQNFTFSYDLVAAQNFTWGATGLTLQLANKSSTATQCYLQLKLRPGFDGRDGEATIEAQYSPNDYTNNYKSYKAPGFSNNKKNNRISVTLQKSGETLQLFIDGNKIADYKATFNQSFNAISFASANSGENDKYYISNIKITRIN